MAGGMTCIVSVAMRASNRRVMAMAGPGGLTRGAEEDPLHGLEHVPGAEHHTHHGQK